MLGQAELAHMPNSNHRPPSTLSPPPSFSFLSMDQIEKGREAAQKIAEGNEKFKLNTGSK
jgi:hypothetical protein